MQPHLLPQKVFVEIDIGGHWLQILYTFCHLSKLALDDMINNLAHYKVFSTFDLRNAYHQVPILKDDRKYTGFEANGRLYQLRRIPFGVTNGVAVFQRLMDNIIKEEKLKDTFPYLDDITAAGVNQADHD